MNSKDVLNKILTLLSITKESDVQLTYARLADGTIVESSTFDVGEGIEVVSEDGTKSPAPDGEHELVLKGAEGEEVRFKVIVKDGKIEERENVELGDNPILPTEGQSPTGPQTELAAKTEEAHPLPMTTDEDPRNQIADDSEETEKDPLISLTYRISELEKALETMKVKMEDMKPEEKKAEVKKEEDVKMEEEELPKLDGAPIDNVNLSSMMVKKENKNTIGNTQNSFLSKLYN
jgi:hypothetical protein